MAIPHKYTFTNIHDGPVYIPEMEKITAPGDEVEFIGNLDERTPNLHNKRILNIEDHGPADEDAKNPTIKKIEISQEERAKMEASKPKEEESKGTAAAVSFDDVDDSGEEKEKPAPKPVINPPKGKGKGK